jgi:hypothetical protein
MGGDGRGLIRGGRVRRTRHQIRQQTAPVGILYPASDTALRSNLKRGDAQNLLPALVVKEECDMIHVPSAEDTVERMDRPGFPCASAGIDVFGTYSAPKVDSIGDSCSDSGKQFGSVESGAESCEFQANADICADVCIEDSVAGSVQLQDSALNTIFLIALEQI